MTTKIGDMQELLALFLDENYQEIYSEDITDTTLGHDFGSDEYMPDGRPKVTQGNHYRNIFGKILRRYMIRDDKPVTCKLTKMMARPTYQYAESKDIYRPLIFTSGKIEGPADTIWYACPKIFLDEYPHMFRTAPNFEKTGPITSMIKEARRIKMGGPLLAKFNEVYGNYVVRSLFKWLRGVLTGRVTSGIFVVVTKYAREMSEAMSKILIPIYGIGGRIKSYNMVNTLGLDVCYTWKDERKYKDESIGIIISCVKPDHLFRVSSECPVLSFTDSTSINTELKLDNVKIGKSHKHEGNEITFTPNIELAREDTSFKTLGPGKTFKKDREKTYDERLKTTVCITPEYVELLSKGPDWDSDLLGLLSAIMSGN